MHGALSWTLRVVVFSILAAMAAWIGLLGG
jgi:hypothetical protein